ncbi:hypothetical protein PIB30_087776 [Stylosanthes scabra]|uniref:KRAB domain-containing protein n=1 Tax=Stylosanthes scabra TaxID=79078 RepID=A0ABU6YT22_9FABA|nr:hypothetical protein [Stylosanthes scabra]
MWRVLGLALLEEQEQKEGQRFLSVEVLVNQVYDMKAYQEDEWINPDVPKSSFLYSFSKGMPTQTCLLPGSHVSNEKAEAS